MLLGTDDPVWYIAYGSNLLADRFACYLVGGRPPGSSRTYLGCRDPAPARRSVAMHLPGGLAFAGVSTVWSGGLAFYNPAAGGEVAARAYLVSFGQFSDVVAQEARTPVGVDLPLGLAPSPRRWQAPSGVYETILHVDDLDDVPVFTITSLAELAPRPPSAAYLRVILAGLGEAFDWAASARVDYLLRAPGVAPSWSREDLLRLCSPSPAPGRVRRDAGPRRGLT